MLELPTLKIGASGVRGIAGESLTPQLVTSFAAAFGTYCGHGPIVLGTDTRPSREMVTQAAISGLLSVGSTPIILGIVPAPALQLHIRRKQAAGGICITASHNPVKWNALKFFGEDGTPLRPNQLAELTDLYHQGLYPRVDAERIPDVEEDGTAIVSHCQEVLKAIDADAIRHRAFKVAIDCCNGAASVAAPDFLGKLNCKVVEVHTNPKLPFPRPPEPSKENLGDLCNAVKEAGADLGFAQDADADRLALVDETGTPLGEEYTVVLAIRHVLQRQPGPVVVNVCTTRIVEDLAAEFDCPVYRTRVGEVFVVQKMLACGSPIGGEGNGSVVFPQVHPCRDSFVGMGLVLEALAQSGETLSQLRKRLPQYAMIKEKVPCRSRHVAAFIRLLKTLYRQETLDLTDGLKVVWPDRWLHVRGSNTEPVLRILAEARSEADARSLIAGLNEYLRPVIS